MSGMRAINPPGWARPKGYSNAVVGRGTIVMVAGQIGWNTRQQFESDDFVAQLRQALANTVEVLGAAGAKPEHVARMTWYVTDKQRYLARIAEVGAAWRDIMGRTYPAMTLLEVSALVEDRALIEIESTAIVPDAAT
ncbi:MAG TPA: RidA family protein [Stellaceae bacterium]|nr:RidA family protein [Stellaceae bacterium]